MKEADQNSHRGDGQSDNHDGTSKMPLHPVYLLLCTPQVIRCPTLLISFVPVHYSHAHLRQVLLTRSWQGKMHHVFNQLWTHSLSQDNRFVERYTCYCHFREVGWTPKTGLKYGADFLLYKHGPEMHHSSYAVQVCGNTRESEGGGFSWQDIAVSVRVNEAARKEVMICSVEIPASCQESVSLGPPTIEEIRNFKISCTIVKRWVPERGQGQ